MFALSPEGYTDYLANMDEVDQYIKQLQEGWIYYKKSTTNENS